MSWYDVREYYIEPDDDFCEHEETEEHEDGVYCLRCGENLGTPEDLGNTALRDEAEKKEGTAECMHLYMVPNYDGRPYCSACGWIEEDSEERTDNRGPYPAEDNDEIWGTK